MVKGKATSIPLGLGLDPRELLLILLQNISMIDFKGCRIISWNVRGVVNSIGCKHVRNLVHRYSLIFFIFWETHTLVSKAKNF